MKRIAVFFSCLSLFVTGLSTAVAQESAGTPAASDGRLAIVSIEIDTPAETTFGFVRTTIAPGGSYRFDAGSAPSIRYVETGSLNIQSDDLLVVASSSATPEAPPPTGDDTLDAGTAFVVGAGGSAELRNDGADPVNVFDFLSASDSATTNETDVSHLVLAQQDYQLPAGPVTVTLSRTMLEPGEQFDWPADPATTTLYPLDRADAFQLTGQGFNRGKNAVEIYVLTIAPS